MWIQRSDFHGFGKANTAFGRPIAIDTPVLALEMPKFPATIATYLWDIALGFRFKFLSDSRI
jgi:hypothetical protein